MLLCFFFCRFLVQHILLSVAKEESVIYYRTKSTEKVLSQNNYF